MVEDILKKNNLKITKQRIDVLKSIIKLEDTATITNIIYNCNIDKSTIYRILNVLVKHNIIIKDVNYNNDDYYMLKNNHKHYIKCVKCNKMKLLDKCPFDSIKVSDYEIINHSLKIEGICKECKERQFG